MTNYTENLCVGGTPSASGGTPASILALTDNNPATRWTYQSSVFPQWVQYKFIKPEKIKRVGILSYFNAGYEGINEFRVFGSKTGLFAGEQVLLFTGAQPSDKVNTMLYYEFNNSESYQYIRIMIDSIYPGNGGNNISINEMQMFGEVSINKVFILKDENYYYYDTTQWVLLGASPTQEQILEHGMDSITAIQIAEFEASYGIEWSAVGWTDGDASATGTLNATPHPQILEAKNSVQLTGVESAVFKWSATGGSKVAVSVDNGVSYHTFKNGAWIDITTDISQGMTASEYTAMTWEQFSELKGDSNFLKHRYYIPDNSTVDDILITASLIGNNKLADTASYSIDYDQSIKTININIKKNGTYFATYIDS